MGKALAYDVRVKIVERAKSGEDYKEIAMDLCCSESGVKKIWYAYKKEGETAFHTKYSNCGRESIYDEEIREEAKQIRDNMQGGDYVRSKLLAANDNRDVPSVRTLNTWWKQEGTNRKKGRPTKDEKKVGVNKRTKSGK